MHLFFAIYNVFFIYFFQIPLVRKDTGNPVFRIADYVFPVCRKIPHIISPFIGRVCCSLVHHTANALLLSGKLDGYLADIDQQAQEMMNLIVQQMAQAQGITEALKSTDQMAWVGMMNNIRASATEIVNTEIIYS